MVSETGRGEAKSAKGKKAPGLLGRMELERENEQLKQQVEQLITLHEIGRLITSALELDKVLTRVVEAAIFITKAEEGALMLLDERTDELYVRAHKGLGEKFARRLRIRVEDSIAGEAVKTGEPRRLTSRDRVLKVVTGLIVNAILYVPMTIKGRVIGVLSVDNRTFDRPFTEDDEHLLLVLADYAAIAIENARLLKESERRAKALSDLYTSLLSVSGLREVLGTIAENALNVLGADLVTLYEYIKEQDDIRIPPIIRGDIRIPGILHKRDATVPHKESIVFQMMHREEPVYAPNAMEDWARAGFFAPPWDERDRRFISREEIVSSAGIPLLTDGEPVGVLFINYRDFHQFTPGHRERIEIFANQAALAIRNARLFQEAQRTSSFLQTLVDSSPDAIIAVDRKGNATVFNEGSERIIGYGRDEVLGKSVADLYWGGEEEARRINRLLRGSKNGRVRDIETFVKSKEGEKIPILLSGSLLYDEEGERIGSVGVLEDLRIKTMRGRTRKLFQAIESINRSEGLQVILDTIVLESVTLLEAEAGCILLTEDGFLEVKSHIGYPDEQVEELKVQIGQGLIGQAAQQRSLIAVPNFDSADQYSPLFGGVKSGLAIPIVTGGESIGVLHLESNEKDHFWAEDEFLDVLAAQAAVAISRAQLLWERERTQRGLIASANAVAAGQIAAGVAHEVKNGLNNIALAVTNIGERIQKESGIKARKYFADRIDDVEKEILRLYDLVKRLHRFSQRLEPRKTEAYFNDIVTSTLELLGNTIRARRMKYSVKMDPALDRPPTGEGGHPVFVDERQMRQVITNLTLNAIDASRTGGRLLFETELHTDTVEFRITDYGKGITPEEKRELFEPFFTTKPEGTGLGMYICKLIVKGNHGGRIEVKSKPGKGSTFSVFLPRQQ